MLNRHSVSFGWQRGTTLVEVLVTLVILAIGILGVSGLQAKIALGEMEASQRSQALLVLGEMMDRLRSNSAQAASYVTAGAIGTGDAQPADCTGIAPGPNRDICEWSNALKGAAEQKGAANIGGMQGARGCVTEVQAPNPALGICTAGVYQVSVAWQGSYPTAAPLPACGQGSYGADDGYRRAITAIATVATTSCF